MPTRVTPPPRRRPLQDVGLGRVDPEREVLRVALFVADGDALSGFHILDLASAQFAVLVERFNAEVDRAVHDVGVSARDQGLDHLDLLRDVSRRARRDVRPGHAQRVHVGKVLAHVLFHDLHGLDPLAAGALQDPVLAVVEQMPDIGDVLHIPQVVAAVAQPAHDHVEGDIGFGVAQVGVVVDGWTAHIHGDLALGHGFEGLFLSGQEVIDCEAHGFAKIIRPAAV